MVWGGGNKMIVLIVLAALRMVGSKAGRIRVGSLGRGLSYNQAGSAGKFRPSKDSCVLEPIRGTSKSQNLTPAFPHCILTKPSSSLHLHTC